MPGCTISILMLLFSACRQHMFLGGIWCSTKKPPTAECLGPILEEIQGLTTDGECMLGIYIVSFMGIFACYM